MKNLLVAFAVIAFGGIAAMSVGTIEIPYTIRVPGRIVPIRECVIKCAEGRLATVWLNNVGGAVQEYSILQADNGDLVDYRLHPSVVPGGTVAAGDTIALATSIQLNRELAQLQGELATESAKLSFYRAGEKGSVIREARERLKYANTQVEYGERNLDRLQTLLQQDVVSEEEGEKAERALQLFRIQVAIEEEQLRTVQTGVRNPEIGWVEARIASLQEQIAVLDERVNRSTILAPFAGQISESFSPDTLAVVQDISSFAVLVPVPWRNRDDIAVGQSVALAGVGVAEHSIGRVEHIGSSVWNLNGEMFTSVTVTSSSHLTPGLLVTCAISGSPVTPVGYLGRFFRGGLGL
jgi:hypothetical protein